MKSYTAHKTGRQWQILKDGQFYCLATDYRGRAARDKSAAIAHAVRLNAAEIEARDWDAKVDAARHERAAAYIARRAERRTDLAKQAELF